MSEDELQTADHEAEGDEELRRWLEQYVAAHPQHSTAMLSRAQHIGVSRRALDSYLSGTYFLPKEWGGDGVDPRSSKIEHAIGAYRERVEGTNRHGYTNTFAETRTWFQLQHACQIALNEHAVVVIYARPGVGKSRCLMGFAARQMATAPIAVLCSANVTTRYFVQKLARELKLSDKPATAELEDRVAEKLKRYPRPLIVDLAFCLYAYPIRRIRTCVRGEIMFYPIQERRMSVGGISTSGLGKKGNGSGSVVSQ